MNQDHDSQQVLNRLIQVCKDGEEGFKTAGENAQATDLKLLFAQYYQQRAEFRRELEEEVSRLGGDPAKSGTVSGTVHRGWMTLKAAIATRKDEALIAECERSEDVAKAAFETALNAYLPAETATLVQQHYLGIKEAHNRIRDLEKACK